MYQQPAKQDTDQVVFPQGEKSQATDVYAFGMVLWEVYSGQLVWASLNFSQLHRRVVAAKEKPAMPSDMPLGFKVVSMSLDNQPRQF